MPDEFEGLSEVLTGLLRTHRFSVCSSITIRITRGR